MIPKINLEDCDLAVQNFFAQLGEQRSAVLYKNGKPCYFFGEIDDFESEVTSLSQNRVFMDYLAQCRERGKTQGTLSFAEIQRRSANLEAMESSCNDG